MLAELGLERKFERKGSLGSRTLAAGGGYGVIRVTRPVCEEVAQNEEQSIL
jgi:hypothetical protein